ncbi:alpha/beta fold hydrolase [Nocardia seriolae]|uniref:3-oxoadipate enol-lactonase n=1 Tax=Nocardia seriolae TaxID=37332 RepID=A0A0B8NM47_9NOCA|nr:alpha/beta hydrolase [Nocardia seriolae]APA94274.1 3-oxoadipate enol-lactonase [Nocardia seriolae]MTJ60508.1 alpha/beta fold hydrolase [Nocardia seriolae]MTJ76046.1 alpha/beta fold hydrolase [Nocardia seriolae]MTJ84606.1 alpha/beta fold hydrolase [Nocardia seriolae]MTK28594.1 alpha/beta fold hydrolase [Nocardia seriolae]
MLVKLPEAGVVDALTAPFRPGLRSRRYRTAAFNTPRPADVIPVTTRDGAKLRVHAYGPADGEVIVLAHGWSCAIEYWNPQINAFAGEHRVVAFDQRGHGESDSGTRPFSPDQLADDFSDLLDAVLHPGQRAVLVGHSMGGMTIQAWAAKYPEQVQRRASAVLLATTAARQIPNRATVIPLLNDVIPGPDWLAVALFGTPVPLPGGAAVNLIAKHRLTNPGATRDEVDFGVSIVRSCRPSVRAAVARGLVKLDLHGAAANLTVPTTVIAGSHDKLLPEVHSREIADTLADAGYLDRYTVLPTGHLVNIEARHAFNIELHRVIRAARRNPVAVAG